MRTLSMQIYALQAKGGIQMLLFAYVLLSALSFLLFMALDPTFLRVIPGDFHPHATCAMVIALVVYGLSYLPFLDEEETIPFVGTALAVLAVTTALAVFDRACPAYYTTIAAFGSLIGGRVVIACIGPILRKYEVQGRVVAMSTHGFVFLFISAGLMNFFLPG